MRGLSLRPSAGAGAAASAAGRQPRRSCFAAPCVGRGGGRRRASAAPAPLAIGRRLFPRAAIGTNSDTSSSSTSTSSRLLGIDLSALEVPDIAEDVVSHQAALGAAFDDEGRVAITFDNTPEVLAALGSGCAIADRSHARSRARVAGAGALEFLHGQTTADVRRLLAVPGLGCEAAVVTPQARCLDLLTVLRTGDEAFLLLGSGGEAGAAALARLKKYVFKGDRVDVADVSGATRVFSLAGPRAAAVLRELAGDAAAAVAVEEKEEEEVRPGAPRRPTVYHPAAFGAHVTLNFRGAPVLVACGSGLASPGYTLLADEAVAADLYAALALPRAAAAAAGAAAGGGAAAAAAGGVQAPLCVPMGEADWQRARVTQGVPQAGSELTLDTNPLEAGLYRAVSVAKGCYVGQEALSKIAGAGGAGAGPLRQLWGVQLAEAASPGEALYAVDEGAARAAGLVAQGDEGEEGAAAAGAASALPANAGAAARLAATADAAAATAARCRRPIGVLTSTVDLLGSGHFGLALLRCRTSGGGRGAATLPLEGLALRVRSADSGPLARVVDVAYASRRFEEGSGPPAAASAKGDGGGGEEGAGGGGGDGSLAEREAAALAAKARAKEEADRARAEKLKVAQAKIDAFKAKQQQQKG